MSRARTDTEFLNGDLDLTSSRALTELSAALAKRALFEVNAFRRGRLFCAGFEVARAFRGAEQCARLVLAALDGLDAHGRVALAACSKRQLDLGFRCGRTRYQAALSAETIARLARHGVGVGVTLYAEESAHASRA
jgi:hypothetical protein